MNKYNFGFNRNIGANFLPELPEDVFSANTALEIAYADTFIFQFSEENL